MTGKLIALLVTALAFAGLGLWGQQQHLSAVKAKTQVSALQSDLRQAHAAVERSDKEAKDKAQVSLQRQQRINQLLAQAEVQSKALNEALKENRAWADALVPDGVWNAIVAPAAGGEAAPGPRVDRARPDPAPKR